MLTRDHHLPETLTLVGSEAKAAAMHRANAAQETDIIIRQVQRARVFSYKAPTTTGPMRLCKMRVSADVASAGITYTYLARQCR